MATKLAGGILLYKLCDGALMVLLSHPGGPLYAKKDVGVWSIPKGELEPGEAKLTAAKREFEEELGRPAPAGRLIPLGRHKQPSGKMNYIWAIEGEFEVETAQSNTFEMEWPPKSGQIRQFPEMDRAAWYEAAVARTKLRSTQVEFINRLEKALGLEPTEPRTAEN